MENRRFDLEAAMRGEKVQCENNGGWIDVHFIGVSLGGAPVIQMNEGGMCILSISKDILRMAPKPPKEMWIQLYENEAGEVYPSGLHDTPEKARDWVKNSFTLARRTLSGDPQRVLVPQK